MEAKEPIDARIVLTGTFEFRDAQGELVKTMELMIPVDLKEEHANQRSE